MQVNKKSNIGVTTFLTLGISSFYLMDSSIFFGDQEQVILQNQKNKEVKNRPKSQSLIDRITSQILNNNISFDQWFQTGEALNAFENWKKSYDALKILIPEFKKEKQFNTYALVWLRRQKDKLKNWKKWIKNREETKQYFSSWRSSEVGFQNLGNYYQDEAKKQSLPIHQQMLKWIDEGPKKRAKSYWISASASDLSLQSWIKQEPILIFLKKEWQKNAEFKSKQQEWITHKNKKPSLSNWEKTYGFRYYQKWINQQTKNKILFDLWKKTAHFTTKVDAFLKKGRYQTKRSFQIWKNTPYLWTKNFNDYVKTKAFNDEGNKKFKTTSSYQTRFDQWKKTYSTPFENWLKSEHSTSYFNEWIKIEENLKKVADDSKYGFKKSDQYFLTKKSWITKENYQIDKWFEDEKGKEQFSKWVNLQKNSLLTHWKTQSKHYQSSLQDWIKNDRGNVDHFSKEEWLKTDDGQKHFTKWVKKPAPKQDLINLWKTKGKDNYEWKLYTWISQGPGKRTFTKWSQDQKLWNNQYQAWEKIHYNSFLKIAWEKNDDNDFSTQKQRWLNLKPKRTKMAWLSSPYVTSYYQKWKQDGLPTIKQAWQKTAVGSFNFFDSQNKWINTITQNRKNIDYWYQNSNHKDKIVRKDHSFNEQYQKWWQKDGLKLLQDDFATNQLEKLKAVWLKNQDVLQLTKTQWSNQEVSTPPFLAWTSNPEFTSSYDDRLKLWKKDASPQGYKHHLDLYISLKSKVDELDFNKWKKTHSNVLKTKWLSTPDFKSKLNTWVSKQNNFKYSQDEFLKWGENNEEKLWNLWRSSSHYEKAFADYKQKNAFLSQEEWIKSSFFLTYWTQWKRERDNPYILNQVYKKGIWANQYKDIDITNTYSKELQKYGQSLSLDDLKNNIKNFKDYNKYFNDWNQISVKYLRTKYLQSKQYQEDLSKWTWTKDITFAQKRQSGYLRKKIAKLINQNKQSDQLLYSNNSQYKKEFYAWLMPHILNIKKGNKVNSNDVHNSFVTSQEWGKSFYQELISHLENTINQPLDYFRVENDFLQYDKKLNFYDTTYRIYQQNGKEKIEQKIAPKKFPNSVHNTWYRFGETEDNKFIVNTDFAKNFQTYVQYVIQPLWILFWDYSKLFDESPREWKKRIATTLWSKVYQLWKNEEYDPKSIMDALDIKTTKKEEIINQKVIYNNHIPREIIDRFWSIDYQVMDGLGDGPTGSSNIRNNLMFSADVLARCYSLGHIRNDEDKLKYFYDRHRYSWKDLIDGHKNYFDMMEILSFMDLEKFKHLAKYHDPTINRKWKQAGEEWLDREIPKLWAEFKTHLSGWTTHKWYPTPYNLDVNVNSEYSKIKSDSKWKIPLQKKMMIRYDAINEFEESKSFQDWKNNNPTKTTLRKVQINNQKLFNLYEYDALNKLFVKFFEKKWLFEAKRRNDYNRLQKTIAVIDDFALTPSQISELDSFYNGLNDDQLKKEKYRHSHHFATNFLKWANISKKEKVFKNSLYVKEEFFKSSSWKEELFVKRKLATINQEEANYFAKFKPYQSWFNQWFTLEKPITSWNQEQLVNHNLFSKQLFAQDKLAIEKFYLDWKVNKKLTQKDFEQSSDHTTSFITWKNDQNQGLKEWWKLKEGQEDKTKQEQNKYLSREENWGDDFNAWVDLPQGGEKYFEEEIIEREKWTQDYQSSLSLKNSLNSWSKIKKNILPDFIDDSDFFQNKWKEYNQKIAQEYHQKYLTDQYQKDFDQYWNQIVDETMQIIRKERFFLDLVKSQTTYENIYLPWFKNQYQKSHYQSDLTKWIKVHPIEVFDLYKSKAISTQDYNQWQDPNAHHENDYKWGLKAYDEALKDWVKKNGTTYYLQSGEAKQDYYKWVDPQVWKEQDYPSSPSFNSDLLRWSTIENVGPLFLKDKEIISYWEAFNIKIKKDLEARFQTSKALSEYFQKWIDLRKESWNLFTSDQNNLNAFQKWLNDQYVQSSQFKKDLQDWITKLKVLKIYEKEAIKDYQKWDNPHLTKEVFQKEKAYDDAYEIYINKNGEKVYINSFQASIDYQNWEDPLIRKKIDYELNLDFYQKDFINYYLDQKYGFTIGYKQYSDQKIERDYADFENEYIYGPNDFLKSENYQILWTNWINDMTNTKPLFAKDDASTIDYQGWVDPLVRTNIKFRELILFKKSLGDFVNLKKDFLIKNLFIDSNFMKNIYDNWPKRKWANYWDEIGFNFEQNKYLESPQARDDIIEWLDGSFEKGKQIFRSTLYAQTLFNRYKSR